MSFEYWLQPGARGSELGLELPCFVPCEGVVLLNAVAAFCSPSFSAALSLRYFDALLPSQGGREWVFLLLSVRLCLVV